jgi:hypothetical protein
LHWFIDSLIFWCIHALMHWCIDALIHWNHRRLDSLIHLYIFLLND